MTKQEYLNLLFQATCDGTFPSVKQNGMCRYRLNDKRCAVGLLLSDRDYDPIIEGGSVFDLGRDLLDKILPEKMCVDELLDIQYMHDEEAKDPQGWNSKNFLNRLLQSPTFFGMTPES